MSTEISVDIAVDIAVDNRSIEKTTPDGVHFQEFINHGGWDTYL